MSSDSWRLQIQRAQRSALITIKNYTHMPLARASYNLQSGAFRVFPQELIPPYAEVQFAASNKGVLSGVEGTVMFKALVTQPDVTFTFWFRSPFVDPRQSRCTIDPPAWQNKFQIQHSEVMDNHYEVTWSIYTTLTKQEAPPANVAEVEQNTDLAWMKEQHKASRSVTLSFKNMSNLTFYRKKFEITHGVWTCLPPDILVPSKSSTFGSRGTSILTGTTGRIVYQTENSTDSVEIFYDNPFIGDIQVIHSRPQNCRLEVAYRKQEHLRITVEIQPLEEKPISIESPVVSSSSTASSAIPANLPASRSIPIPRFENENSLPKAVSPTQIISGEEDEDDVSASQRSKKRTNVENSASEATLSRKQATESSRSRNRTDLDSISSPSSSKVSLDLVHNAARYRLFGVPLIVVVEKEGRQDHVPRLVTEICQALKSTKADLKGVFISPGPLKEVLALRMEYEKGDHIHPDLTKYRLKTLATVMKMFLRELPLPLIPPNLQTAFVNFVVSEQAPKMAAPEYYSNFFAAMPMGHKQTCRLLLETLKSLCTAEGSDLGVEEAGIVFSPIICPDNSSRPGQWSGAIASRAITVILSCLDDIDFEALPTAPVNQPVFARKLNSKQQVK